MCKKEDEIPQRCRYRLIIITLRSLRDEQKEKKTLKLNEQVRPRDTASA